MCKNLQTLLGQTVRKISSFLENLPVADRTTDPLVKAAELSQFSTPNMLTGVPAVSRSRSNVGHWSFQSVFVLKQVRNVHALSTVPFERTKLHCASGLVSSSSSLAFESAVRSLIGDCGGTAVVSRERWHKCAGLVEEVIASLLTGWATRNLVVLLCAAVSTNNGRSCVHWCVTAA